MATILDKIGFGLDDFAQLSANISVPVFKR